MEKVNDAAGGREAGLGHKQKPLADWTLGEVQDFCCETDCGVCPFYVRDDQLCRVSGGHLNDPLDWALTEKPRFTEEEMTLFRQLYSAGVYSVTRQKGILRWEIGEYRAGTLPEKLLPSLREGQEIILKEVLNA